MDKFMCFVVLNILLVSDFCHGNQFDNEVNKQRLYEDKLIQSINNLRDHVISLEAELAYIKRKVKNSHNILKRFQNLAGDNNQGCVDTGEENQNTNRGRSQCPPQFDIHRHDSCYRIESNKVPWEKARENCIKMDAHLVSIETDEEQKYILDHINNKRGIQHCDFWTGGTDQLMEGAWVWNHTGKALGYDMWHAGEPNNGGGHEHCLWLDWYFGWKWNDANCMRKRACFICEIDKN